MRELLRSPELRIVVMNALFQPLGAIVLAVSLLITAFVWTPFIIIGLVGYALIVLSTLSDEAENRRVVEAELHPPRKIDLGALRGAYRQALERAQSTQRQIDAAVASASPSLRETLKRLTADVDDLIGTVYDIALQAQSVESSLAAIDRSDLASEISRLQRQAAAAPDAYLRDQYLATLRAKQEQMNNLAAVAGALDRWQAQLAHAQASLGEILSQILKIKSSAILQATFDTDGLSDNLRQQTTALRETAKAFDRLHADRF